jgi:uncharacterized membrane protein
MYHISSQYSSLLIPWIFIASIYGVKWLLTVKHRDIFSKLLYPLLSLGLLVTLVVGPSPVGLAWKIHQPNYHDHVLEQVIALVPEDASLYTQDDVFPHICYRTNVYYTIWCDHDERLNFFDGYYTPSGEQIPWSNGGDFDYILVDDTTKWSVFKWADDDALQRMRQQYHIIEHEEGIYLFQRNGL